MSASAVSSAPAGAAVREVVLEPAHGWAALNLRELWDYRDLLYFLAWRDIKGRYQQMALGPLWIVIQPLMSMVLYTVVFGVIAHLPSENQPYAVFAYAALLPWGFFSDAVASAANCFVENRGIMAKVYFPRLLLPMARMLSGLADLGISFLILVAMLVGYGIRPNWGGVVVLPVLLLIAGISGLAVGLWFSGIVARFRDFGQVAGYLVRAWMYATPVVYSMEVIPEQWRTLYQLNPLTGVVQGFRWALLGAQAPNWGVLAVAASMMVVVFVGGVLYFRRTERSIVDVA
ncbi:MAG: ABC transporter permease [Anaerolineales bacterium]|nr:ABC transporter permease [Anaerolineales bacterium]